MPWFIHTAEVLERQSRTVTIGPFARERTAIKVANALRQVMAHVCDPIELLPLDDEGLEVFVARYRWMISDPNAHEGATFDCMRCTESGRLFIDALMAAENGEPETPTGLPPSNTNG